MKVFKAAKEFIDVAPKGKSVWGSHGLSFAKTGKYAFNIFLEDEGGIRTRRGKLFFLESIYHYLRKGRFKRSDARDIERAALALHADWFGGKE